MLANQIMGAYAIWVNEKIQNETERSWTTRKKKQINQKSTKAINYICSVKDDSFSVR